MQAACFCKDALSLSTKGLTLSKEHANVPAKLDHPVVKIPPNLVQHVHLPQKAALDRLESLVLLLLIEELGFERCDGGLGRLEVIS